MNWENVLKIKTPNGDNLIVKDVDKFIRRLRGELNIVGLENFGRAGRISGKARKASIVVKQTWVSDTMLRLVASVRHPTTRDRDYFEITLMEDETGDFYFATALGPSVTLTVSSVLNNESELIEAIGDAVERTIQETIRESKDLRDTSGEDRHTADEVRADVERANPGYIFHNQKMLKITDLKEKAEKEGITYETLLRNMGYKND